MQLKDISFSDIYIGHTVSYISGATGEMDPVPTPPEVSEEVFALREICIEKFTRGGKREFAVRNGDTTYRASVLESISEQVFVLRRFSQDVPEFMDLGLASGYASRLLARHINGLVVVCGAVSQGKTTTASALLKERLVRFGGVAVTIEDPPEMPLEGLHGDGVCYQTWTEEKGFADSCKNAARWAPSIIFIGEIRNGEAAIEALRAAMNGRLVICTFHADNVVGALERMYSMAVSAAGGSPDDITSMMAHSLHSVIHQKLSFMEGGGHIGSRKTLKTEALFFRDPGFEGAKSIIRSRRFEQLNTDINRQSNLMLVENSPHHSRSL